ncbi:MAG: hypothetical protein IJ680_03765 [Paludibacteraceae bacterium]|nr:hypothetical protein [Paludibacteraceae bacterium]
MLKSLFYKEWLKTRRLLAGCLTVLVVLNLYCMLNVNHIVELKGAAHIWLVAITNDAVFVQMMQYVPLIIGILLAVAQYVPEMHQKRIKLTLHLPVSTTRSVGSMLLYGWVMLLVLYVLSVLLMSVWLHAVFASEIVMHILLTTLTWYVAGLLAYQLTAWICLEPTWKRRAWSIVVAAALLRMCFMTDKPEAYNGMLVVLLLLALICTTWPFISIQRFREGRQ